MIISLLVVCRIAATTWANVIQKRLLDPNSHSPLQLFTVVWGWMALLAIPWWLPTLTKGSMFWFWMLLTCALEVPGNVLLLRSLRSTELSIFGPLSSSKPAISLLLAFIFFRELPSLLGLLGVVIVLAGSLILTTEPRSSAATATDMQAVQRQVRRAGIRDRLLAVLLTAAASVFLKQSLAIGSPWEVLASWCMLSWLLAALWSITEHFWHFRRWSSNVTADKRPQRLRARFVSEQRTHAAVFMVAVAMLVMQGCTIALFDMMPVGYALALFQIGSVVSVFVGHRLLGEAHLVRRLFASIVMVVGAVLIIMA